MRGLNVVLAAWLLMVTSMFLSATWSTVMVLEKWKVKAEKIEGQGRESSRWRCYVRKKGRMHKYWKRSDMWRKIGVGAVAASALTFIVALCEACKGRRQETTKETKVASLQRRYGLATILAVTSLVFSILLVVFIRSFERRNEPIDIFENMLVFHGCHDYWSKRNLRGRLTIFFSLGVAAVFFSTVAVLASTTRLVRVHFNVRICRLLGSKLLAAATVLSSYVLDDGNDDDDEEAQIALVVTSSEEPDLTTPRSPGTNNATPSSPSRPSDHGEPS